ncbi:hypothetical protein J6590_057807 [Homalodisca vitripennis]|nr:hypothetical protein J6590_057807 [Homalodisca vitripennis]
MHKQVRLEKYNKSPFAHSPCFEPRLQILLNQGFERPRRAKPFRTEVAISRMYRACQEFSGFIGTARLCPHSFSPPALIAPLNIRIGDIPDRVEDMTYRQLMEWLNGLLDDKLCKLTTKDDLANLTGQVQTLAEENKQLKRKLLSVNGRLWINRAHPLGRDGKKTIVNLSEDSDVEYLISQPRRKLKGTGYVIHRDFHERLDRQRHD